MAEAAEKSFKLFLAKHEKLENAISIQYRIWHNLEKLREKAGEINEILMKMI